MSIFNPDSKFMYYLGITGDLIIANFLFALCSLPIFTIGAAGSGLYTALRNIDDRKTANTPVKSFFKGFKTGFLKITILWTVLLICILLLGYSVYFIYMNKIDAKVPAIVALVGIVLLMILSSEVISFHSRFDCTKMQLLRNSIIVSFGFPLKALIMGALCWAPIILMLWNFYIFIWGTPLWFGIYFSFSHLISGSLMKKPYEKIIYPDGKPEEEEEEDEEE